MASPNAPGDSPAFDTGAATPGYPALGEASALQRIEAALARIDAALPNIALAGAQKQNEAAMAELRQRHGALRMATAAALVQIDALIGASGSDSASSRVQP